MPKNASPEVIIVGGGLAGLTLAVAMGEAGLNTICLDREAPATQLTPSYDGRTTALSFATHNILQSLGVWPLLAHAAEPIKDIRVTDGRAPLALNFPFGAVNGQPFGWIVENRLIREALLTRLKALKSVQHLAPMEVRSVKEGRVTLKNGKVLTAQLVVGADGKDSLCRQQAGITARTRAYGQTAIVCTIKHSRPHHGLALENFRPHGPFAVLPMTNNRSSVVWSEKASLVPHYLALSEPEFIAELTERTDGWLGTIKLASPRFAYPLTLLHAARYTAPRLALISEAAHKMHPIAGQGLNIGMRDVALLAELVVDAARQGHDLGSPSLLNAYERARKPDTLAMLLGTDVLTHLFSNRLPGVTMARRAGLTLVEHTPPAKQLFMRYAMGLVGPKLRLTAGHPL